MPGRPHPAPGRPGSPATPRAVPSTPPPSPSSEPISHVPAGPATAPTRICPMAARTAAPPSVSLKRRDHQRARGHPWLITGQVLAARLNALPAPPPVRVDHQIASQRTKAPRRLSERLERRPDLGREQLGLFPGGEVAAPVCFVEVGEGGVALLDPAARGAEDLAGERGEADRDFDLRRGLPGRQGLGSSAFPI